MYGLENRFPKGKRNEWPCWSIADVYNESPVANVDAFEGQTASGVLSEPPEVRVEWLLDSNRVPIDAQVSNCVDNALQVVSGRQ